jgi:hypothetical protein
MRALIAGSLLSIVGACSTASVGDYEGEGDRPRRDTAPSTASEAGAPAADAGSSSAGSVTLTVSLAGTGAGTVMSTPSGLTCAGTSCTGTFASGTTVGLVPAPGLGSSFAGWGGACSGADTCTPKLAADTAVTATFETPAATYSGSYTHTAQSNGCTFNNTGTLTITIAPDGAAFASNGTIDGLQLLQKTIFGCKLVTTVAGTSQKEPMTLSGKSLTGTWTFSVQGMNGALPLPYTATWDGDKLSGTWTCAGCTGQFSLTKQ